MMQEFSESTLQRQLPLAPHGWLRRPAELCMSAPGPLPACACVDIAAEDWDMLFRAALELLARLTAPEAQAAAAGCAATELQTCATAVRECLDALDHLRRSVPLRCQAVDVAPPQTAQP